MYTHCFTLLITAAVPVRSNRRSPLLFFSVCFVSDLVDKEMVIDNSSRMFCLVEINTYRTCARKLLSVVLLCVERLIVH